MSSPIKFYLLENDKLRNVAGVNLWSRDLFSRVEHPDSLNDYINEKYVVEEAAIYQTWGEYYYRPSKEDFDRLPEYYKVKYWILFNWFAANKNGYIDATY